MTVTTAIDTPTTDAVEPGARTTGLWRTGLAATVAAALATVLVAAGARAADVPLAIDGEEIPIAGFATMTALWSVVGILMAAGMARWLPRPRATFVGTAVVLTALSFVPSVTADTDTATSVVLVVTHVVAAAIVVPALASRLPASRAR
jgi:hypothetical protein